MPSAKQNLPQRRRRGHPTHAARFITNLKAIWYQTNDTEDPAQPFNEPQFSRDQRPAVETMAPSASGLRAHVAHGIRQTASGVPEIVTTTLDLSGILGFRRQQIEPRRAVHPSC